MKGIILTGGKGTRLYPASKTINKGLLPVYDKPMIYYPLSTLMLSGITEILVIASKRDIERFKELLGDGSHIGLDISYEIEYETKGIGNAFILGENFIGNDDVCLVLGDMEVGLFGYKGGKRFWGGIGQTIADAIKLLAKEESMTSLMKLKSGMLTK